MLRGAHEEAPAAMEVQARALFLSRALVWCCWCGVEDRTGQEWWVCGEGGEGRDGDKRRGATIRAVGCGPVVRRIHVSAGPPPAPWVLGSLLSFCVDCRGGGSLDHCGFVLFLALGRGAVAAAEFISCPPHGFLLSTVRFNR